MSNRKAPSQPGPSTRDRVLAAAERLLAQDKAEFSMRDLAAEAGVSFATPFNQFGGKLAIMRALSAARIEEMHLRAAGVDPSAPAVDRVLAVIGIAAGVMGENAAVNRAVMGAIGAPGAPPGDTRERSRALWAAALADGEGLAPKHRPLACAVLPNRLAAAFRGVLSFWTAGEIPTEELDAEARAAAAALLFGFSSPAQQTQLAELMRAASL